MKNGPILTSIWIRSATGRCAIWSVFRWRSIGCRLDFPDLKKIGVVLKRALYFITCGGRMMYPVKLEEDYICRNLLSDKTQIPREIREGNYRQLSLFDDLANGPKQNGGGFDVCVSM